MLFSMATGYALRALAALRFGDGFVLAKDLAGQLDLPGPYLAKVLQTLAREGLLESQRGPHGGFRLARPAQGITLGAVVAALNTLDDVTTCVLGFSSCMSPEKPCALHAAWREARVPLDRTMAQVTVGDLHGQDLNGLRIVSRVRPQAPGLPGPGCAVR